MNSHDEDRLDRHYGDSDEDDGAKIENPRDMANRIGAGHRFPTAAAEDAIRARDEQIAAWCEEKAKEADGEPMQGCFPPGSDKARAARAICVSAAGAFRSLAAILLGSPT